MTGFCPSRNAGDADRTLATLIRPQLDPQLFAGSIRLLQRLCSACKAGCPPPWASRDAQITPEMTYQSEQWLPLEELRPHFYRLYRQSLSYPPVFSSSPFADAASWAGMVSRFPPFLRHSANPASLLEQLLSDDALRIKFLFWSFMPERFYGCSSNRYPGQSSLIADWIRQRRYRGTPLRCLDAASGDGANSYAVARLLAEQGWSPDRFAIEGWTLDPLEAWAAAHGRFPHDPARELSFRQATADCFEQGFAAAVRFYSVNILDAPNAKPFDLILCNGLLGGPIIHERQALDAVVRKLTGLLAPGGMLLAADHFHAGWKQQCPQQELRALLSLYGLVPVDATEGVAGSKPDQESAPGQAAAEGHGQDQLTGLDGAVAQVLVQHQGD
ncbi:MAG: chemotaxis protein CheR [Geobacteraceae bacterium]|nr:chemotaxis protein CheR [Geobacteraceae bacterium]